MKKKYLSILIAALLPLTSIGFGPITAMAAENATRWIRDRAGREVRIPAIPRRIACIHGPSYEKLFAFGATGRVAMVTNVLLPWCYRLNPELKNIPVMGNYAAPDIEELLKLEVDLVIYHPFAKQISAMSAAGIPVVVPYDGGQRQTTLADFIADAYTQIRFYGELLGGDAPIIAERYCRYVNERIEKVISVTSQIPAADRPKVFYFCGQANGPAGTQTRFATADWMVTAAGGLMQTHEEPAYFVSITTEQMILWDPDIIVVSTLPSIDPVIRNPHWQKVAAVKNQQVFMNPEGLFYWSHFGTEWFLGIQYLAKLFHPDRFADLDLLQEVKEYYRRFYHYPLTDDEAHRILNHQPPQNFHH